MVNSGQLLGLRRDGRKGNQIRKLEIEFPEAVSDVATCQYAVGNTRVCTQIRGPMPCKRDDQESLDLRLHGPAFMAEGYLISMEKELTTLLQEALMLAPRTYVSVSVLVLLNDGSLKTALFNSVFLACLDAGVPLSCFYLAAQVCMVGETLICDPTLDEEDLASLNVIMACRPQDQQLVLIRHDNGELWPTEHVDLAMEACRSASNTIWKVVREILGQRYSMCK